MMKNEITIWKILRAMVIGVLIFFALWGFWEIFGFLQRIHY